MINNEKVRLEKISELFNLNTEENELNTVTKTKEKIIEIKKSLETRLSILSERTSTIETVEQEEYIRLLPWKENIDEWDKENLHFIDFNTRDNYLKEIKAIDKLFLNKESFFKYDKYKNFLSNSEIFEGILIKSLFEQYDEINDKYEEKIKLLKIIEDLDNEDKLFDGEIDFELVKGKIDFNFDDFDSQVNEVNLLKNNLDSSDEVISQIMDLRNDLIEGLKESSLDQEECPLCGYDWKENTNFDEYKLLNALEDKKEFFESLIDGETQHYRSQKELLDENIEKLKLLVKVYLTNDNFQISESVYMKINEYKDDEENINSLFNYLVSCKIQFSDLMITDLNLEFDMNFIESKVELLLERLNQSVIFDNTFLEKVEEYQFLNKYNYYFEEDEEKFNTLTRDLITNKAKFIEYSFYNYNQSLQDQIRDIQTKITNLNTLISVKIAPLETLYKSEIKKHKEKIIKDIELPFYIYSGKILQSIRNDRIGGIFIKDPVQTEGLQNIRFVSDYNSDHDVINTVSSGQLAGIVIALTLTLNKVYSNGFNSIMIDDPVQSMDDINMISLIELFRNEFNDNQIFVSTHEEEIEKYILYKFMKYNLPVTRVDVMNKDIRYKEGI